MKKYSRTIYTATLMVVIVATLIISSLRTFALLFEFDADASYYAHDAALPSAFLTGAGLIILAAAVVIIILRQDIKNIAVDNDSRVVVYVASMLGFVIVAGMLLDFFLGDGNGGVISTLALIFAVPAALYCLVGIALPIGNKTVETVLSMFMILWLFFIIIGVYFDNSVEINSPNKTLALAALALFELFIVSECKFRVETQRPWLYLLSGFASVVMGGLYVLPNIVLLIMNAYPDNANITRELMILCLFAYVIVRLCLACVHIGENADDVYDDDNGDGDDDNDDGDGDEDEDYDAAIS